jgi:three-Cys-motif partner protein
MPVGKAPIATSDWLKDKLTRLIEMTEVVKQESPNLYAPDVDYGFWSLKKEIALMYWAYPFQQIARSPKSNFDSFYYIDLFAGSGLMKAEAEFFVGSPIVAVGSALKDPPSFSQYICMEANPERKAVLEKRLVAACSHFGSCGARIYEADCNRQLDTVLKNCCSSYRTCFLAFIDPQGYSDLKWSTVERLLNQGKGDLIINFPTMGINRNMPITENAHSITEFFGDEESWKDCSIEEALENYKFQISERKAFVDSIEVRDEQQRRLYDLIFATGSQGMRNVFDSLKVRLDQIKTKTIRGLYEVATDRQKQMEEYCTKT